MLLLNAVVVQIGERKRLPGLMEGEQQNKLLSIEVPKTFRDMLLLLNAVVMQIGNRKGSNFAVSTPCRVEGVPRNSVGWCRCSLIV